MPTRVPSGAVAIVGAVPITLASVEQWLPSSLARPPAYAGCVAVGRAKCAREYRAAVKETVSSLIGAQWLLQESRAEGIDEAVLDRLVSQRTAKARPQSGMTRADLAFQARLEVIAEALKRRHSDPSASVTGAQVARYYAAHSSRFVNPPVRHTLMVVTHSLVGALRARAALARGESWGAVAKRWSVNSSAIIGGAFAVVGGAQSRALEHAVFAAKRGRIVGPVQALSAPAARSDDYYLFEVTGAQPGSAQPLAQVAGQIRETMIQELHARSWAAFAAAYEKRWSAHTLCASGYVVAECRNHRTVRGHGP